MKWMFGWPELKTSLGTSLSFTPHPPLTSLNLNFLTTLAHHHLLTIPTHHHLSVSFLIKIAFKSLPLHTSSIMSIWGYNPSTRLAQLVTEAHEIAKASPPSTATPSVPTANGHAPSKTTLEAILSDAKTVANGLNPYIELWLVDHLTQVILGYPHTGTISVPRESH